MEATELALAVISRTKREECERTKHGPHFSKWKVLVGPSDWKDHSLGKEGADRYKVYNLPTTSSPGLYELGIAVYRTDLGRKADKLDSRGVVVVYVGQADNVRTRLQSYGRNGAHLNNSNDGPRCFDDIFSRGYSIVYRWAPMKNKEAALEAESELLGKYDYPWNKGGNGRRRHDDILPKLNKDSSNYIQFSKTIRKLLYISQKPAGITIKASKLPLEGNKFSTYADEESHNFFSEIHKFTKSRPRLVLDDSSANEDFTGICGSNPVKLPVVAEKCPIGEGFSSICGIVLDDGSLCRRPPVQGNKRCEEHRWRKINGSNSKTTGTLQYLPDAVCDSNPRSGSNFSEIYGPKKVQPQVSSDRSATKLHYDTICGVDLVDGTFCTRQPAKGRVRCEEHKGMKIKGIKSKSATQDKSHVYDAGSNLGTFDDRYYCSSVCGAQTLNGSYCRRPVKGNTRCWQHSKQVFDMRSPIMSCNDWYYGESSVCGAPTRSGSYCRRTVNGGGRCWQH